MRSIKSARLLRSASLLFGLLLALLAIPVMAATVSYPFRVVDNSGNLVSGATVVINGTTLTAGTPSTVAGKVLGSGATLSSVSVTYYDFGSGDYVLTYDPAANGEAYFPITVSKSGSAITGANSLVGLVCALDSSKVNQALPNASPAASGGFPTLGTGSGQINPDGTGALPVSMTQVIPASPTAGTSGEALFYADQKIGRRGTAQGGTSTTITLDAGASSVDNSYSNHLIKITSGTGGGQFATITGYVGSTKVATITRPAGSWGTTPDNTSVFLIEPEPEAQVYSNLDKSNTVLATSEHTAISGTDVPAALAAQGYTTARAPKLDNLDATTSSRLASTSYTIPPSTGQIAAAILSNPSNLLVTDSSGSPVLSTAVINAVRDAVFAEAIDGGVSFKSWVADMGAVSFGSVTQSFNSGTHTLNSTFKRQDNATTGATVSTVYSSSTTSVPVTSRSGTASP